MYGSSPSLLQQMSFYWAPFPAIKLVANKDSLQASSPPSLASQSSSARPRSLHL